MNDMSCIEFRRVLASEPRRQDPAVLAHQRECVPCRRYRERMLAFESKLEEALDVPVPAELAARVIFEATGVRRPRFDGPARFLAVAAGLVLAVAISTGLWLRSDRMPLPLAVVQHINHEPASLLPDRPTVPVAEVDALFRRTGVKVGGHLGRVEYARLCYFRGRLVTHLVVAGKMGPITILLLPHIHVSGPQKIDEEGFHGTIIPAGSGSIAIVGNKDEPMEAVERRISDMVSWST